MAPLAVFLFLAAIVLALGHSQPQAWSSTRTGALAFVRDNVYGTGAGGVKCTLYRYRLELDSDSGTDTGKWTPVQSRVTSSGGGAYFQIGDPVGSNYKFQLEIEPYYAAKNLSTFYPYIEVVFEKLDSNTHLIPIMVSPYSYSAYRGHTG